MRAVASDRASRSVPIIITTVLVMVGLTAPAAHASTTASGQAFATSASTISGASPTVLPQAGVLATAKKPARPQVTVIPGAKRLTVSWPRVSGATKYQIRYATRKDFRGARTITTVKTAKTLTKLKTGKVYYVKVRALRGKMSSGFSAAQKIKTTSSTPASVTVTAVPAGVNSIKVAWSQPKRAESIQILVSHHNKALDSAKTRFVVKVPVHARSTTITIPSSWRTKIGDGSGNPVFVRVLLKNAGKSKKTKIAWSYTQARTPSGTSAQKLRFATYNAGSVNATKNLAGRAWTQRQPAVVNAVHRSQADVIAFQEVTTARVNGDSGDRQYQALAKALAPTYSSVLTDKQIGTAPGATSKGAHIFYRSDKVRLITSGLVANDTVTSIAHLKSATEQETVKHFAWALLENTATKERFYVVSAHLPNSSAPESQRLRLGITQGIHGYMSAKPGASTLPIVLMGDLNTDVGRYPTGPTTWLRQQGYYSAAHAVQQRNIRLGTTNNQYHTVDGGYPARPFTYAYVGTRIDHIFIKNSPGAASYDNQVVLRSNGTFDERFRGSDHNLQVAVLSVKNRS